MQKADIIQRVLEDPHVRIATARQSFEWFFNIYLNAFMTYETAPFQKRMFEIAEDKEELLSVIISFRGSAKTTIMALAYPIWAILGVQQRKFILIICDTQDLARQRLANIRTQLEENTLLKDELGPFKEDPPGEWSAGSLVLKKYNARIMVASREQSVRGVIHDQYRPDVVILDDVENLDAVRSKESRDRTYRWFVEEIQILGDKGTKFILIGNKLHEDSLSMRLREQITKGERLGHYYEFPVHVNGTILWLGKYPNQAALKREKQRIGDPRAWAREFELKIMPDDNQIVYRDWITYYDVLPNMNDTNAGIIVTGVDLAISQSTRAHYTAMVPAYVVYGKDVLQIYILSPLVNKRLNGPDQITEIVRLDATLPRQPKRTFYVENVAYQQSLIGHLTKRGVNAEGVRPKGSKDERLRYVSFMVKNGNVLFPRTGAEDLIDQLVNFGVETYDDLADAFSILLQKVDEEKPQPTVRIVRPPGGFWGSRWSV